MRNGPAYYDKVLWRHEQGGDFISSRRSQARPEQAALEEARAEREEEEAEQAKQLAMEQRLLQIKAQRRQRVRLKVQRQVAFSDFPNACRAVIGPPSCEGSHQKCDVPLHAPSHILHACMHACICGGLIVIGGASGLASATACSPGKLYLACREGEDELEQDLTDVRYVFQDYIAGERLRGLAWLLTWTVLAIWITGVLNKDSPLAP